MKRFLSMLLLAAMVFTLFCGAAFADDAPAEEAPARTSDVVILFTSDVHCGVDQGFGYAGLEGVRDYLVAQGNDVILVDDGDNIQGEPIGTMTKGQALVDLMGQMGYSIAIPGGRDKRGRSRRKS